MPTNNFVPTVHISFISDFICPWCYIGKKRLEYVQEVLKGEINLEIEMKPYVLYPHIPPEGLPKSDFASRTKPGMGRSLRYEADIEELKVSYKKIEHIPYTFEAHRLLWLIPDNNLKYQLAQQFFTDYFTKGQNLGDTNYLKQYTLQFKVKEKIISSFDKTQFGAAECRDYIDGVKGEFVAGVPSLKLDHQFLIPGLQSREVWLNYIRRAGELLMRKKV